MRITIPPKNQGNALVFTLLTVLVIGMALASYLALASSQNVTTMRSLAWTHALTVVEAGVEEALTQIHYNGITNLAANSWNYISPGLYYKKRSLGNGTYCEVVIKPVEPPVILSSGFVPAPMTPSTQLGMILGGVLPGAAADQEIALIKRKVRVNTKRSPWYTKAMLAKGQIDLKGFNVGTDSFDSLDPLYNTLGKYDPAKNKANGDVATNSELVDSLNAGNAKIRGKVSTGPEGTVDVGPGGSVGDKGWVDTGSRGIQPGHVDDDMNVDFPEVVLPEGTPGSVTAGTYSIGGTNYNYVLSGSAAGPRYLQTPSLGGKVYVTGNVALLVSASFSFTGNDCIYLAPGATLTLYVGAPSATLGGNGVINSGSALDFQYLGLNTNTKLAFGGNGAFVGAIYAPYADFQLNGGGNNITDFIGASVTSTVQMNGHFNFHYDEALGRRGPQRDYVVTAWNELVPDSWDEL